MRRLQPFHFGLVTWLAIVTLLAAAMAYAFRHVAYPSAAMMRSVAGVAATLFVAWVVEAVWMTTRLERTGDDRENWLGSATGFGIGGLVGIAVSLLVAAHREAGHGNFLDWLGCWWAVLAILTLGLIVAAHPVIVERWTAERNSEPS